MYIVKNVKRVKNKVYTSTLLVKGYRENGKVKHKVISNLSSWPEELIEEFKLLLKGNKVNDVSDLNRLKDLKYSAGKSCGGIIAIYDICKRLGILKALGNTKKARLSALLIMGRILTQCSTLHLVSWPKNQAVEEVLKIKQFNEDDLYDTLDWLSDNQQAIEDKLFKYRNKEKEVSDIFLYDVTSSYLEGEKNELAAYGYNRDKKKGKKQIVVGLMLDKDGYPISVEAFKGNTQDPKTVLNQLNKLKYRFNVNRVIFANDRGMVKSSEMEHINSFKWHFITGITKPQIRTLLKNRTISMSLFDEELAEVRDDKYRYIFRRNPYRAEEIKANRNDKMKYIEEKVSIKNRYLLEHKRASEEVALRDINKIVEKLKLKDIIDVKIEGRALKLYVNEEKLREAEELDGCYVMKTDVFDLSKETINNRYKDLSKVEYAFRTMKTGLEEVRPIYVRKEKRTRGHIFVCMLSYMVVKYIKDHLKQTGFTDRFIFDSLDKIQYIAYKVKDKTVKLLPYKLLPHQQLIMDKLHIKLPARL